MLLDIGTSGEIKLPGKINTNETYLKVKENVPNFIATVYRFQILFVDT